MDRPELVRPEPSAPRPQGSMLPVLFVGLVVVLALGTLLFLTQGWVRGILLIVAAVICLPLFHYLTWGWWLGKLLNSQAEADDAES
jgi:hypothetical protein